MKVNCGTRTLYNAQCEFCCCMRNEIITWKGCDIMKKANTTIDFVKFIGSIVIFALHCNALSDYPSMPFILELMARWGVPFYFICSAFFLFRSRENDAVHKKTIIQYTRRIGCLYLLWFVYNLPNVMLTTFFSYFGEEVLFVPVTFRPRQGGVNSINVKKIVKIGIKAVGDFVLIAKDMKKERVG